MRARTLLRSAAFGAALSAFGVRGAVLAEPAFRSSPAATVEAAVLDEGAAFAFRLVAPGREVPRVDGRLTFDAEALRISATVHDRHFHDGERAWRAGDGFTVNVVVPEGDGAADSADFVTFGFARERGRPVGVLVNDSGRWSLKARPELAPRVAVDAPAGTARYEIAIPWAAVPRFRLFLDARLGVNVVYVSRNDDGSRTILKLVEDDYDTERTNRRRFLPLTLRPAPGSGLRAGGALDARLVTVPRVDGTVAIVVPAAGPRRLAFEAVPDGGGEPLAREERVVDLPAGTNRIRGSLRLPPAACGRLTWRVRLDGEDAFAESFVRDDLEALSAARAEADRAEEGARAGGAPGDGGPAPLHARARLSTAALALRLEAANTERAGSRLSPREDPQAVLDLLAALTGFTRAVAAGTAYVEPGTYPAAFRSSADGSVQPFTLLLPPGFEAARTHDLLLALHGSGVDEVRFVEREGRAFGGTGAIVAGPRGRHPSGWWLGASENDALDVARTVRGLLPVGRVVPLGFSMGGYGAWRLAFRHPEEVTAAVVLSGSPVPLLGGGPDDDVRGWPAASLRVPVLVLHARDDRAVPSGPTEELVGRLRRAGRPVTLLLLESGGHGGYDAAATAVPWLRRVAGFQAGAR